MLIKVSGGCQLSFGSVCGKTLSDTDIQKHTHGLVVLVVLCLSEELV